jgi:hypothetical protein
MVTSVPAVFDVTPLFLVSLPISGTSKTVNAISMLKQIDWLILQFKKRHWL